MEVVWREFHRFHRLPLSSTGFHILPVDSATLTYSIPNNAFLLSLSPGTLSIPRNTYRLLSLTPPPLSLHLIDSATLGVLYS
jgi:hypothetical protein